MEISIFLFLILFWIIYYAVQSLHDVAFIKEVNLFKDKLDTATINSLKSEHQKYELKWKYWDTVEKIIVKVVMLVFVYLFTKDLIFCIQLFLFGIIFRTLVHDFVIAVVLHKTVRHIGPDYIWADRFLRNMEKIGINQYIVKTTPLAVIIIWILIHLKVL
ncbi:MAG: hypothetical protein PVH88_06645 [Ignavibacteria bacterium]|jgi:hypothetical protein